MAEGLPQREAAARYLGLEREGGAVALRRSHQAIVDRVRALARRRGEPHWRLIGVPIGVHGPAQDVTVVPIDDWAAAHGLDDFSHAEQQALYKEAFPADRKTHRNQRLRGHQLALLQRLATTPTAAGASSSGGVAGEGAAGGVGGVESALPHHRLDDWLPESLSRALVACGLLLLSDLLAKVQTGGRWWTSLPKIGVGKALRLVQHLEALMPGSTAPGHDSAASRALRLSGRRLATAIAGAELPRPALPLGTDAAAAHPTLTGKTAGTVPASPAAPPARAAHGALAAPQAAPQAASQAASQAKAAAAVKAPFSNDDGDPDHDLDGDLGFDLPADLAARRDIAADVLAVRAWLRARAGSDATAKSYRRELGRFLLFLDQRQRTLGTCRADDCLAYMALLQNVPPEWTSKRTAPLGHGLWSPFAGPLSHCSQQHAVVVVGGCFTWLVAARYLARNPWVLVNRRTGDDRQADQLASRAFSPEAWHQIHAALERLAATEPAAQRLVFLMRFLEATGLRAAELLGARLADLRQDGGRWTLQVHGKGSRNRVIPLASQAQRALAQYLASRGVALGGEAQTLMEAQAGQGALPLLASLKDPREPLSYRVLYGSMKTWLNKAIDGSDLSWGDKVAAARASPHWLRHTCGTRALERGVPLDVVGQLLGHADPRTTAKYTRAQLRRVGEELEKAFG